MKLILWYSICSNIGLLVPIQKFIEFVTRQKKNFLNRMKKDAAIDFFVKSVLAVDLPKADFRAKSHPRFHGAKQLDDGFE